MGIMVRVHDLSDWGSNPIVIPDLIGNLETRRGMKYFRRLSDLEESWRSLSTAVERDIPIKAKRTDD